MVELNELNKIEIKNLNWNSKKSKLKIGIENEPLLLQWACLRALLLTLG